MNREILFKAKRKNWRELPEEQWWIEGYYCKRKIGRYTDVGFVEEYKDCIIAEFSNGGISFCDIDPETVCQCIEAVEEQPKIGEWISCSERLPEKTGCFLVCYKGGDVAVARYGYNTSHAYKCFWVGYVREKNIIAWQPLPEPYNTEA